MRYMIGSQIGWAALPVLIAASVCYMWVAERLVGRKMAARPTEKAPSLPKAA
jgi:hypothetical protein